MPTDINTAEIVHNAYRALQREFAGRIQRARQGQTFREVLTVEQMMFFERHTRAEWRRRQGEQNNSAFRSSNTFNN